MQPNVGPIVVGLLVAVVILLIAVVVLARRVRAVEGRVGGLTRGEDGRSLEAVLDAHLDKVIAVGRQADDLTRRVGALEVTMPKVIESINSGTGIDRTAVTASTKAGPTTSFDAEGGSVTYSRTPLSQAQLPSDTASEQPMPKRLAGEATPDPSSFGIALGPPIDADEAESAWDSLNTRVGTLLVGLAPVLAHVEGGSGRRLVAGPISSEADARELCGRMAKVGIACASVPFIGDPLPLLN